MKKILTAALTVLLCLTLASTAQAATPSTLQAAALGDSYGSGVGAGNYIGGTTNQCWQSLNGTAQQVVHALTTQGRQVDLTNVTCSGDTINDVRAHQLGALTSDTDFATLSVGGNDVGFKRLVELCLMADCSGAPVRAAEVALLVMGANLVRLLGEIHARSPKAQIILTGYGQPMSASANGEGAVDPICGDQYFTLKERQEGAEFAAALDLTLRTAADEVRRRGQNVTYVSPFATSSFTIKNSRLTFTGTLRPQFVGHSLCDQSIQYYRGLDALAPPPAGDPAGQTAVMHGGPQVYGTLANLVLATLKK